MDWSLLLPAAVAVAVGLAAGHLQRRLRPSLAAGTFTTLAAVGAVAVVGALVVLASLTLARIPWIADQMVWCSAIAGDHDLPTVMGAVVLAGLAAMVASAGTTARRHLHDRIQGHSGSGLVVLPTDLPTAYAVPGRPGYVVVSAGMLRRLDGGERRVLLAHERAHLRCRHHRYLWITDLATSTVPVLRPLQRRVRFATERWADEEAAAEVGDRSLVARTICRAALIQHDGLSPTMALAGLGIADRVEALLDDHRTPSATARMTLAFAVAALVATMASSTLQMHHLATFAAHVCRLS